ncbi:hypothetical protein [Brooklawnia cerclae]|uniref:Oxidoreductase n=1 Tax=Brooklawnia cerclae TaxID=349934 RepID=A0ABX0SGQ4_9ACTN|nr:hypothetical protein [Brooklawnia cerclae]
MNALGRFFRRAQRRAATARADQEVGDDTRDYLMSFIASRRGVEAWVEPPTSFNRPSLLLVAHDGEWVRRGVPSSDWAYDFCAKQGIPVYQGGVVPYPQRKRDWDARHR